MSKSVPMTIAVGGCLVFATIQAHAQSTATQIENQQLGEVVVSGQKAVAVGGLIQPENAAKSRETITQEYIETQPSGQTVIQSMNLLPGVNFTNTDPYGSSGGNLRIRGFDGARVSLMLDGIQLNDTGNYSMYTNQQVDPEIIAKSTLNLGTTDVDSPTASATGGTINLMTKMPTDEMSFIVQPSFGSYSYKRIYAEADTGKLGPWGTKGFFAVSDQEYDKYRGPGDLKKLQFNARAYQELENDNFMSLAFHFNRNRNFSYRSVSKLDITTRGYEYDYDPTCNKPAGGAGAQNEGATGVTCTNYYADRINPSNTGNIRGQSSFGLTDHLRLTIDPSFQYTLANGGGYAAVSETDGRLRGSTTTGVDLNGDGDTLDSVGLYTPNNTNTRRYSLNSSLIWTLDEASLLRFGYTLDYGRHRQTGQYTFLDANGNPTNIFGGLKGDPVLSSDSAALRGRDRFSIAKLNQLSLSYVSKLLDDRVHYNVGVRAPFFERQLNQYCYTQVSNGNQYCTTQTPGTPNALGYVAFAGSSTVYKTPYSGTKKYDKFLPNLGASFNPWNDENSFYASYAKGFSAPRTDNLYSLQILDVQPETTDSFELGYRYQGSPITASTVLWSSHFQNRIVSSYDPDLGLSVDRNVGVVDLYGLDSELGWKATDAISVYGSASYNHSNVKNDIPYNTTDVVPTSGKALVETPTLQFGSRVQYEVSNFEIGLQGKYVGKRWSTDVNDESAPSYTVVDADARYSFKFPGLTTSYVQVNVINVFDRDYLGSISTSRFTADATKPYYTGTATSPVYPLYQIGSPRTVQVSLRAEF